MRIHQIAKITILLMWAITTSDFIWALTPTSSMVFPLTQREQAARLWGIAGAEVTRKLYPLSVETIEPKFYYQRNYRTPWKEATLNQRILLAEKIGEQGRARFAAERGWIKILGFRNRGIRQGPDSVYWDKRSGRLRVLEAKGGTSPLKWTFNSLQGTNLNAIKSAERVLQSSKATHTEKVAAARAIVAAQQGRLETGVIRTNHVLGTPGNPKLKGEWDHANVGKEARKIKQEINRNKSGARAIFRHAHKAQSFAMLKYRAPQGLAGIGFASELAGRFFTPVTLGVDGLQFAMAYHQYGFGRISQREFYHRTAGPVIVAVFTAGGAMVGGIFGMQVGGIMAIPGAITGAKIGDFVAIPVQFAADYM